MKISRFQALVRKNLPFIRGQRVVALIIEEGRKNCALGKVETAVQLCKKGLEILDDLAKLAEPLELLELVWYFKGYVRLYMLRAEANFVLGRLLGSIADVDVVLRLSKKITVDPLILSRCYQIRAYIMVIIGADGLSSKYLQNAVDYLNRSKRKDVGLQPLPEQTLTFCAADWHRTRRREVLLQHPEIKSLYESNHGQSHLSTAVKLESLTCLLIAIRILMIFVVGYYESYVLVLLFAMTIGATVSYGFQALNHDLSHLTENKGVNYLCMIVSSALCNFPWAMYYQHFHSIHHAYTGSDMDRDGDILFQPWHSPPSIGIYWCKADFRKSFIHVFRWSEIFGEPSTLGPNEGDDSDSEEEEERKFVGDDDDNNNNTNENTEGLLARVKIEQNKKMKNNSNKDSDGFNTAAYDDETLHKVIRFDLAERWQSRFLWSILVPLFLYPMFLLRKALLDRAHMPFIEYDGLMVLAHLFCYRVGGFQAITYIWLSAMFSLGGFCHPYLGFWLIQHQSSLRKPKLSAEEEKKFHMLKMSGAVLHQPQPTVSYNGSFIWHVLNFGELWHVEHHDFPNIPAMHYPELQRIAPEFYKDLLCNTSILESIREWIVSPDKLWMQTYGDFARRDAYMDSIWVRRYQAPEDTQEEAEIIVERLIASETNLSSTSTTANTPPAVLPLVRKKLAHGHCALCKTAILPSKRLTAELSIISAARSSCNCPEIYHRACSRHLKSCPSCHGLVLPNKGLKIVFQSCLEKHIRTCLSGSPCTKCANLDNIEKSSSMEFKM